MDMLDEIPLCMKYCMVVCFAMNKTTRKGDTIGLLEFIQTYNLARKTYVFFKKSEEDHLLHERDALRERD